jgi:phosphoglycolate phosphatase-like HAD superfamily hydrolase
MSKTLVIFDIDGTLVYSNRIDSQCFAQTYETLYGEPFPSIDWTTYPHVTDTTIFNTVIRQHFNRPATPEEIATFQDHFVGLLEERRRVAPHAFCEVPNARSTVERLLDDDRFHVGIATGGWLRPALLKLAHVGIPAHRLIMSCADGKETREAIIGEVWLQTEIQGLKYSRSVYVGDALWDVQTTRRMNLNFVGIRRRGDFEVLQTVGATVVLKDYVDYQGFLQALETAAPPAE